METVWVILPVLILLDLSPALDGKNSQKILTGSHLTVGAGRKIKIAMGFHYKGCIVLSRPAGKAYQTDNRVYCTLLNLSQREGEKGNLDVLITSSRVEV